MRRRRGAHRLTGAPPTYTARFVVSYTGVLMPSKRLTWAAVVALAAVCAMRLAAADPPSFFFVLGDPQFGMYESDKGFDRETKNFERAIAAANRLHPAFVVVCGDLVNRPGDPDEIAAYQRVARELDPKIPLYNVAGNHDVGNTPTPESVAAYRRNFGPDYYRFRVSGIEGIVLDLSLLKNPAQVPEEVARQQAWLKKELEEAKRARVGHVLVFQHQPWFVHSANEPDDYWNIPLPARREYLDLLEKYGVEYVFAGHLHQNASGTDGSLQVITSAPVGKPLGKAQSGIGIVIVRGRQLEYHYYPLDAIPAAISSQ